MLLKVQCEKCRTKYKLDEARIQGRGAKITCPRCRHVFVVMKDAGPAANDYDTDSELEEAATVSIPVAPPTSSARRQLRTQSVAVSGPPMAHSEPALPHVPRPRSADDLRWKEVGITTFKVKVAIGLVYDFSDVGTLKKYIADNRVVPTDRVSFNGKVWHVLKDIGSLDDFFVDQWVALKQERLLEEQRKQPAQKKPPGPQFGDSSPDLGDSLSDSIVRSASPPRKEKTTSPSANSREDSAPGQGLDQGDLFGDIANEGQEGLAPMAPLGNEADEGPVKRRSQTSFGRARPVTAATARAIRPPAQTRASGLSVFELGTLAVLVGVCAYLGWFYVAESGHTPVRDQIELRTLSVKLDKILKTHMPMAQASSQGNVVPPVLPGWSPTETQEANVNAAPAPKPEVKNERARYRRAPRNSRKKESKSSVVVGSITPEDMYQLGQSALRSGDNEGAISSFRSAVTMSPKSQKYHYSLGYALYQTGNYEEAESEFRRTLSLPRGRSESHKWLGEIYARQGRKQQAIESYKKYLESSPRDSEVIRSKIEKLTNS